MTLVVVCTRTYVRTYSKLAILMLMTVEQTDRVCKHLLLSPSDHLFFSTIYLVGKCDQKIVGMTYGTYHIKCLFNNNLCAKYFFPIVQSVINLFQQNVVDLSESIV